MYELLKRGNRMGWNGYPLQKAQKTSCFIVFYWWLMVEWTFGFKTKCLPPRFSSLQRKLHQNIRKKGFFGDLTENVALKVFYFEPFSFCGQRSSRESKNFLFFWGRDRFGSLGLFQTLNEAATIFASPMLRCFIRHPQNIMAKFSVHSRRDLTGAGLFSSPSIVEERS